LISAFVKVRRALISAGGRLVAIVLCLHLPLIRFIAADKTVETDDRATARSPAFSPLLSARISTVVRSISAEGHRAWACRVPDKVVEAQLVARDTGAADPACD